MTIQKKLTSFSQSFEEIIKLSKSVAFLGSFYGFCYLLSYTLTENIPFPLEIKVLPTEILAIGLAGLFFILVIGFGILYPSMATTGTFGQEYLSLYITNDIHEPMLEKIWTYFLCSGIPLLFSHQLFFISALSLHIPTYELLIPFTLIVGLVIYKINKKKNNSRLLAIFFSLLVLLFLSTFSFILAMLLLLDVLPRDLSDSTQLLILFLLSCGYVVFSYFIVVPLKRSRKVLTPPDFKNSQDAIPIIASGLLLMAAFASAFITPLNAKLGAAALRTFGIGGGLIASYCMKSSDIPEALSDIRNPKYMNCTTDVVVLFDAGDYVYIRKGERGSPIIGIRQSEILYRTLRNNNKKTKQKKASAQTSGNEHGVQ